MTKKAVKTKPIRAPTKRAFTLLDSANGTACAMAPTHNAAAVAQAFSMHGELDYFTVVGVLEGQCVAVHGGNLKRIKSMLMSQAHSLDMMFASLARRGKAQEHLRQYEAHMRLALKAQSQCRATLESLAAIMNPPVVFAKQANIAHGPQQVNNEAAGTARVEEIKKAPTELLEHDHGQRLDTGTARAASGSDQGMEAVGTIHRPAHATRKGKRSP